MQFRRVARSESPVLLNVISTSCHTPDPSRAPLYDYTSILLCQSSGCRTFGTDGHRPRSSEPAGTVSFSISDDGPGVAPERMQGGHGVLGHDLEDPQQLPEMSGAETAQKGGSSGMGLRISRRLAEGQGGGLSIVNRPSAGIGFMVRVTLPGT